MPIQQSLLIPSPQLLTTTHLLSVYVDLPLLEISHKWTQIILCRWKDISCSQTGRLRTQWLKTTPGSYWALSAAHESRRDTTASSAQGLTRLPSHWRLGVLSRAHIALGRGQFPVILGLRSLFSPWLSARECSQLPEAI